jgi:hypothetical protein
MGPLTGAVQRCCKRLTTIRLLLLAAAVRPRRLRLKCDGTRAETRFCLSAKRTNPFKSAGATVQATTGSRGVRISGSNAGYTMFRCSVRILATHSIRQFPLHFPSRASPCAITFRLDSTLRVSSHIFPLHLASVWGRKHEFQTADHFGCKRAQMCV